MDELAERRRHDDHHPERAPARDGGSRPPACPTAFATADDVLRQAIQGISDLILVPGLINLDFADVKTIMSRMGMAIMGTGVATGAGSREPRGHGRDFEPAARGRAACTAHEASSSTSPAARISRSRKSARRRRSSTAPRTRTPTSSSAPSSIPKMEGQVKITVIATGSTASERRRRRPHSRHERRRSICRLHRAGAGRRNGRRQPQSARAGSRPMLDPPALGARPRRRARRPHADDDRRRSTCRRSCGDTRRRSRLRLRRSCGARPGVWVRSADRAEVRRHQVRYTASTTARLRRRVRRGTRTTT